MALTKEEIEPIIRGVLEDARNSALDRAAEICDALAAEGGHNPACCAKAIRDLKMILNQKPKHDA